MESWFNRGNFVMAEQNRFVIPLSVIGPSENISSETVRRVAKRLELDAEIAVQWSPYGRGITNIPGYIRIRQALLAGNRRAA